MFIGGYGNVPSISGLSKTANVAPTLVGHEKYDFLFLRQSYPPSLHFPQYFALTYLFNPAYDSASEATL